MCKKYFCFGWLASQMNNFIKRPTILKTAKYHALNLANLAFADNVALQKEAENRFKTVDSQLQIQNNRWRALFSTI